jgi:hypothetical protein
MRYGVRCRLPNLLPEHRLLELVTTALVAASTARCINRNTVALIGGCSRIYRHTGYTAAAVSRSLPNLAHDQLPTLTGEICACE